MTEEWRPVLGFEGVYSVSSLGRVRRDLAVPGAVVGRILKPSKDKDGYRKVLLSHRGVHYHRRVNRLVCDAFHGPAPEGKPWALHRDGNNVNDIPENLYWGSPAQNIYDSVSHGTHWEAKKTECLRGHPLDEGNTFWQGNKRSCKICRSVAMTEHRNRMIAQGLPEGHPKHGTRDGYGRFNCRCEPCKEAAKEYKKRRRNGT